MSATLASYTVVVPARLCAAAVAEQRPATQVFVRRRLMVAMVFIAVVVALSVGAGSVLANRGGAPASTSAVRPASVSSAASYVVQPGDTIWSIAQRFHGEGSQMRYVDALVAINGGSALQVGQVMTLP